MQGLQIDCRLAGSWCPPANGLHLDGLLAWAAVQVAMRGETDASATYENFIHDLPLERHEFDGDEHDRWIWKASVMHVVGWIGQSRLYLTQKTPATAMLMGVAEGWIDKAGGSIIDTQRNFTKNGAVYTTIEYAHGLRSWCVGDADGVAEYLSEVKAVGVKKRIAQGALLPYEDGSLFKVTPCDQANTLWMRRNSPVRLIEESTQKSGRWRAPYWSQKSVCWSPNPQRLDVSAQAEVVEQADSVA